MPADSMRLVQALVGASSRDAVPKDSLIPRGAVVTVSRAFGSGGKTLAEKLAKRLGVRCFDREILDAIVESADVNRWLMEELDEQVRGTLTDWVHTLLTGKSVFAEDYRRHLVNVLVKIAGTGGVIVGRGGHVVLADREDVFRLRIVGSPERCAERLAARDGITQEEALRRVREVDAKRHEFLRALFGERAFREWEYDLTLNSDVFDYDQMIELTVAAMRLKQMEV